MLRMVVFVHPRLYLSWLLSILAQSISTRLISEIHLKSKLVPMVFYVIVEKVTSWKVLPLLSQPHCHRECPFSPKDVSRKVQPINARGDLIPTVLLQAANVSARDQFTQTTTPRILQSQSLHSPAQARRFL